MTKKLIANLPLLTMRQMWPHGNSRVDGLVEGMARASKHIFWKYGIDNEDVLAIMMAQFSHECGAGTEMVENLNYSATRIRQVWPSRGYAVQYAGNPQGLANAVYNGRMGNRPGSNDGWNFRGRGLAQTTGREEYEKMTRAVGVDFVNHPEKVNDPNLALEVGVANFIKCGCLPYARQGDILSVTRRLNGGTVGLAERRGWTAKWRRALAGVPLIEYDDTNPPQPVPDPTPTPRDKPAPHPAPAQPPARESWGQWVVRKFF